MTPDLFLTIIVCLGLAVLFVCALIGLMAMGHFISVNRRPWDDQPPPAPISQSRRTGNERLEF